MKINCYILLLVIATLGEIQCRGPFPNYPSVYDFKITKKVLTCYWCEYEGIHRKYFCNPVSPLTDVVIYWHRNSICYAYAKYCDKRKKNICAGRGLASVPDDNKKHDFCEQVRGDDLISCVSCDSNLCNGNDYFDPFSRISWKDETYQNDTLQI